MKEEGQYQKVTVSGVFMTSAPEGVTPIVFLENEERRVLPIYIGAAEAFSIQTALENVPYPRPLTHDLMLTVMEELHSKIEKVIIDDLNDGIFFARIVVKKDGEEYEFDARPSDSIALAIRTKAPVYVSADVMDRAAVDKDSYKLK
jgi:hypothetical protein